MTYIKRALKAVRASILGIFARMIVRRYKPRIVMVTGSVGKTTTKDAVAVALSSAFYVRKSEKSYNTELGVPLTIFGAKNPWGNPLGWLGVLKTAIALLILPNHYPNLLVLEVGADRPGDLARTLRIATPDAVVVTRLPEVPVHVEAYESPAAVREEEFAPALALAPAAPLIVASDDAYAVTLAKRTPARIVTYGEGDDSSMRVVNAGFYTEQGIVAGMGADFTDGTSTGSLVVGGSVGQTQLLPIAAALATAVALGVPLEDALTSLASFEPPPGRGRLFAGKHGSVVIDDSYNSSPAACEEALATLAAFPLAKRRIAVLGDMLELGRYSVAEHERIGTLAAERVDMIVAVGVRARAFASAARAAGMPEDCVFAFDDSKTAAEKLPELISAGDVVLVKGSQSVRTERVAAALLANAEDAVRLVRQEPQWKRRA